MKVRGKEWEKKTTRITSTKNRKRKHNGNIPKFIALVKRSWKKPNNKYLCEIQMVTEWFNGGDHDTILELETQRGASIRLNEQRHTHAEKETN